MHGARLTSYITGFALSIVLTLAAFFVVVRPGFFSLGSGVVVTAILVLAVLQLIVQLFFFLHLGQEEKPRWNLTVLGITIGTVLIIVVAAIWIMSHLNYNMTPDQMNSYLLQQERAGGF